MAANDYYTTHPSNLSGEAHPAFHWNVNSSNNNLVPPPPQSLPPNNPSTNLSNTPTSYDPYRESASEGMSATPHISPVPSPQPQTQTQTHLVMPYGPQSPGPIHSSSSTNDISTENLNFSAGGPVSGVDPTTNLTPDPNMETDRGLSSLLSSFSSNSNSNSNSNFDGTDMSAQKKSKSEKALKFVEKQVRKQIEKKVNGGSSGGGGGQAVDYEQIANEYLGGGSGGGDYATGFQNQINGYGTAVQDSVNGYGPPEGFDFGAAGGGNFEGLAGEGGGGGGGFFESLFGGDLGGLEDIGA